MLATAKAAIRLSAISLFTIVVYSATPVKAQSTTADSFNFDEISAGGKGNWDFSSEDEAASIRDNLPDLRDYDISGRENFDIRLTPRGRRRLGIGRWANKGDRYYPIRSRIFPYYPIRNGIYDY